MSFTGRIRLYLVAIALLPPLLMMAVVYFYSLRQEQITYRENARTDLRRVIALRDNFKRDLAETLRDIRLSEWFARVSYEATVSESPVAIDASGFDVDFVELLDHRNTVLASWKRPGLIGEKIDLSNAARYAEAIALQEVTEYDMHGRHAALAGHVLGDGVINVYAGWYLESRFQPLVDQVVRGSTRFVFAGDSTATATAAGVRYDALDFGSLYEFNHRYQAVVSGNTGAGFVMLAEFASTGMATVFTSFLDVISLVALVSVLAAVGLGMYISGRAKREINNLVEAFSRVAGGDLSTPVMAYEEGEFAQLADSFSEMMEKLRRSQQQLATSQRIAAWQTMARKIAHEIKNPLTPIAISADDLRRSYVEQLPGFDDTLKSATQMIKQETNRLSRILDEFVSFARMAPPSPVDVPAGEILAGLESLHSDKITSGVLKVRYESNRKRLHVDPDQLRQVLVNLVKNAFEAVSEVGKGSEDVAVEVVMRDANGVLEIIVTDNGPGFSQQAMQQPFEPYVSTKRGGSGLGLVICQRIVHDHGGTIELANQPQGGAVVTIRLPQGSWRES